MEYHQFNFSISSSDQSDTLVALLSEQGFEGFEETDQQLKAFIPSNNFDQDHFQSTLSLLGGVNYQQETVTNINWNEQWERSFEPVRIGDFAAIRANFHAPISDVAHEIVITPKMSFGTGHHNTTYLMVQCMAELNFKGKDVFDFGTGTGILAILAEKLGAEEVLAIDNDEWSIRNTLENMEQNGCKRITCLLDDAVSSEKMFDIVLANINLNVILSSLAALRSITNEGGSILFSGLLLENETVIVPAIKEAGFELIRIEKKGEWMAILAKG